MQAIKLTKLLSFFSWQDLPTVHFLCLMERSQRWRMHLSEFEHSRRFPSPTTKVKVNSERGKTERARDRGGPHKSVTMAPSFRSLTDRHYVVRRPLFSQEQYASILKNTHSQKVRRMEREWLVFIAAGLFESLCFFTVNDTLNCCNYKPFHTCSIITFL